jgi:hypothetical protein
VLEIHTSFLPLVTFATKSEWIRKAINKEEIPASALAFHKATHAELLCRLNAACAGDNLGNYSSPSSTWVAFLKTKDQVKQKQSNGNGESSPLGGVRSSGDNDRSSNSTNNNAATMGMITVLPNIRNGPSLSSGQNICLPFVCKGDSCTVGRGCPNAHMTLRFSLVQDLTILDNWVTRTAGTEWAAKPAKLVAALRGGSAPALGVPDNASANRVSTPAANNSAVGNNDGGSF